MKGLAEMKQSIRSLGYVDRPEAAILLGMKDGSNIATRLEAAKVRVIIIPSEGDRNYRMYNVEDVAAYRRQLDAEEDQKTELFPPATRESNLPGGTSNGGRLHHEIRLLRERVEALEKWQKSWE